MSMLKNAVDSIQVGMEDFHDGDERRIASSIRNLYAGILLLFKCKLQEMSPEDSDEVLLKTRIKPALNSSGDVIWVGKGNNTVDVSEIKERLSNIGVNNINWKRLENLQKIRNDIEHYYSKEPTEKIKEAISNSLHLIIEFCEPYLNENPAEILGQECWDLLLNVAEIYDNELKKCQNKLASVHWMYEEVSEIIEELQCPSCQSYLLNIVDTQVENINLEFICESCQVPHSYTEVIGPALLDSFKAENYFSYKDGGGFYSADCPQCNYDTFVIEKGVCMSCFYTLHHHECGGCGASLGVEEQENNGLCSYCRYRAEKVMRE